MPGPRNIDPNLQLEDALAQVRRTHAGGSIPGLDDGVEMVSVR